MGQRNLLFTVLPRVVAGCVGIFAAKLLPRLRYVRVRTGLGQPNQYKYDGQEQARSGYGSINVQCVDLLLEAILF